MLMFVTGATGALGRPTVELLLARGHRVRALAHSFDSAERIAALGAEPVRASLFDPSTLADAIRGADAVVHLATRIPPIRKARSRAAWRENDRIRAEGTRNLVDAALAADVPTLVYPSITFPYADGGDAWLGEDAAVDCPEFVRSTLDAEAEVRRFSHSLGGRRGVVLRLGALYGPHSASTRDLLATARWGMNPLPGAAGAYGSLLWDEDAAAALVAALDAPSGVYNVVDDRPLTRTEVGAALAETVGRRRLRSLPVGVTLRLLGGHMEMLLRSQRVSNERFKAATGWSPSVPTLRAGLAILTGGGQGGPADRRGGAGVVSHGVTVALWAFALYVVAAGLWQTILPASFYESFPGFGMRWVSVDGPFNEHLMRDTGMGNLAIGAVLAFAASTRSVLVARAGALAVVVASVPHTVYHLVHVDRLATVRDQVWQTVVLLAFLAAALLLFVAVFRSRAAQPSEGSSRGSRSATLVSP